MVPAFMLKSSEKKLQQYFDIVKSEEITKEALNALKLGTEGYTQLIENNFPRCKYIFVKFNIIINYRESLVLEVRIFIGGNILPQINGEQNDRVQVLCFVQEEVTVNKSNSALTADCC